MPLKIDPQIEHLGALGLLPLNRTLAIPLGVGVMILFCPLARFARLTMIGHSCSGYVPRSLDVGRLIAKEQIKYQVKYETLIGRGEPATRRGPSSSHRTAKGE